MIEILNKNEEIYDMHAGYRYGETLYHDAIDNCIKINPDMKNLILFSQFP